MGGAASAFGVAALQPNRRVNMHWMGWVLLAIWATIPGLFLLGFTIACIRVYKERI